MNAVTVVAVGDTASGVVAQLAEKRGQVSIVRQCPELAELLAVSQSGLTAVALVATGTSALTATLVDRLNAVGVTVVALAKDPFELSRLHDVGAIAVNSSLSASALAQVISDAVAAARFTDSRGFSGSTHTDREASTSVADELPKTRRALRNDAGTSLLAHAHSQLPDSARSEIGSSGQCPVPSAKPNETHGAKPTSGINLEGQDCLGSADDSSEKIVVSLQGLHAHSPKQPVVAASTATTLLGPNPHNPASDELIGKDAHRVRQNHSARDVSSKTATLVQSFRQFLPLFKSKTPGAEKSPAAESTMPGAVRRAEIIAIWGPTGSPGRTMVATNLAAELAVEGQRVMLIDADTYGASVAASLGLLDESASFAQACRMADQGKLADAALSNIASEVVFSGGSFLLLSGLTRPDRWPELRSAAVERVLESARGLVDFVVVDCGFCLENDEELSYDQVAPRRNATTISALALADTVYAVGQADAIGMPRLVRGLNELVELQGGGIRAAIKILFNKTPKSTLATSAQKELTLAWERFGPEYPIAHFLPQEVDNAAHALQEGRLLMELGNKSLLQQALRTVACAHVQAIDQTVVVRSTADAVNPG